MMPHDLLHYLRDPDIDTLHDTSTLESKQPMAPTPGEDIV